jgi:hypothetical protein
LGRKINEILAPAGGEHAIFGFLKKCDDLLTRNARETFQEIFD